MILALGVSVQAGQLAMDKETKSLFVTTPPLEYPVNAAAQFISGTGRFRLFFSKETGNVNQVVVLQSTGYEILDQPAVRGLSKWRIKPHTLGSVDLPFSFHLGDIPDDRIWRRFQEGAHYATYAPLPWLPRRAFHSYARMGAGSYRLTIDPENGRVTNVAVVETTRSIQLDEAAKKTFLEWRFQPHTVTTVVLPAFF